MSAQQILAFLAIVGALVAILGGGGVLGWWWRKQPERQRERERAKAADDAILGEPEVLDLAGKILQPSKPGLVSRTSTLEAAVATLINQDGRIKHLEIDHGQRLKALEDARVERLVTQAESAHMWRAVADNAADEPSGEL